MSEIESLLVKIRKYRSGFCVGSCGKALLDDCEAAIIRLRTSLETIRDRGIDYHGSEFCQRTAEEALGNENQ